MFLVALSLGRCQKFVSTCPGCACSKVSHSHLPLLLPIPCFMDQNCHNQLFGMTVRGTTQKRVPRFHKRVPRFHRLKRLSGSLERLILGEGYFEDHYFISDVFPILICTLCFNKRVFVLVCGSDREANNASTTDTLS